MSDAAYAIFQKENNTFTGQFAIDDDILHEAGIADLEQYACVPGLFPNNSSHLYANYCSLHGE